MEQAMQLLNRAFEMLGTVLIASSQADKVSSVQADLRQAYAILQREVAEYEKDKRELAALKYQLKEAKKVKDGEAETAKAPDEESEVTDG